MRIRVGCTVLVACAWALASDAHALQDRAAVQAVRVSPDTMELGDPFTLHASVYVPAGRDLRVPAILLPEWGVESLRRVRTEVVEAEDGSLQVVLEYDLIPFEIGLAATPQLEMASGVSGAGGERVRVVDVPSITQNTQFTQNTENEGPATEVAGTDVGQPQANTEGVGAGVESADPPVGDLEPGSAPDAGGPANRAEPPGVEGRAPDRLVVAGRRVFVTSPVLLDDIAQGLQPRPPADVVGSSWHVPAVLGASLLSLLFLGVVTVQTREWLAARAAAGVEVEAPPETPVEWRERALDELDRVRARGHHREGRLRDFYEGAGDAVRAYVAHFDPAWDRSRTSTELMRDLSSAPGWPDPDALARAMAQGEVVKFAADADAREGASATADEQAETSAMADRDWRTMREWVDASGQAPAFVRMHAEIAGQADPADGSDDADNVADPGPPRAPEAVNPEDIPDGAAATSTEPDRADLSGDAEPGVAGATGGPE